VLREAGLLECAGERPPQADPKGVVRQIAEALSRLGLGAFAANHEFMNSQYEINLRHADALTAADRAFLLKTSVKAIAAQHGLLATFMGKPFNDQGGSGTHLHLSLERDGRKAFDGPGEADGVSAELRHFAAGVLAHSSALMAFLNPTINAVIHPLAMMPPKGVALATSSSKWNGKGSYFRAKSMNSSRVTT